MDEVDLVSYIPWRRGRLMVAGMYVAIEIDVRLPF
jgi:hypothetical protein